MEESEYFNVRVLHGKGYDQEHHQLAKEAECEELGLVVFHRSGYDTNDIVGQRRGCKDEYRPSTVLLEPVLAQLVEPVLGAQQLPPVIAENIAHELPYRRTKSREKSQRNGAGDGRQIDIGQIEGHWEKDRG